MVSNSAQAIAQLAQLRDPTKRSQLALGVTEMCLAQPLSPTAEPVAGELLVTLSGTLDRPTKIAMVEKLSASEWAPHAAIRHFAFDEIEVACIVIRKSPRLTQRDMISLAETGSVDHRRHLASRPNLCPAITDALAKPAEAVILRALANNCTAQISESALDICLASEAVEAAEQSGALTGNYALTALRAGKFAIFDHAVARLCGLTPAQWRVALTMGGVRAAAMACQASGLDRTDYPTVHRALQRTGRMHQQLEGEAMNGPDKAATVLRQLGSRS